MFKALLPGSFDPPTHGHLSLIKRAASFCGQLVVGVGKNEAKKSLLTIDEKIAVLKQQTKKFSNIHIESFSGLTTQFAKKIGATLIIRGVRSLKDLEFERELASANRKLTTIETIFLLAEEETSLISSSLIRELAYHRAPLSPFVPQELESILWERMGNPLHIPNK